uniref:Uncharacterized protein n=1 Tax=Rhizophora mucronata TaxID=61149 RepID=A0A2P2MXG3_RHIMU
MTEKNQNQLNKLRNKRMSATRIRFRVSLS